MLELLNAETDVPIDMIKLSDIESAQLTLSQLGVMEFMLEDEHVSDSDTDK